MSNRLAFFLRFSSCGVCVTAALVAVMGLLSGCQATDQSPTSGLPRDAQQVWVPEESEPLDANRSASSARAVPAFGAGTDPSAVAAATDDYIKRLAPQLDTTRQKRLGTELGAMTPISIDPLPVVMKQPIPPAQIRPVAPQPADPSSVQWATPRKDPTPPTSPAPAPPGDSKSTADVRSALADAGDGNLKASPAALAANTQVPMRITGDDNGGPNGAGNGGAIFAPRPATPGADLQAKLSQRLAEYPHDLWAHLDYQLLHVVRDEPAPQLDAATASMAAEDREMLAAILDGVMVFRNHLRERGNMLPSEKVRPLLEMADRLRQQADLNIPTIALCSKVEGFGLYEPIDPIRFIAGAEQKAIIYCEVENFTSTPALGQRIWETKLSQETVLYTESGMEVWNDKSSAVVDRSRNRRHDFFIVKKIKLPATLTIGRYLLHVIVEDQQSHRIAEQTIPLEIVAGIAK